MDPSAVALSNFLGSVRDGLRNELQAEFNEQIKQSIAPLLQKIEEQGTHTNEQIKQSTDPLLQKIEELKAGEEERIEQSTCPLLREIEELKTRVATLETEKSKIQAALATIESILSRQRRMASAHGVDLSAIQSQVCALRVLLDPQEREEDEADATMQGLEPALCKDSAVATPEEQAENTQQAPPPSSLYPKLSYFSREMSVESSATFCTEEQSVLRRKRTAKDFWDTRVPFSIESDAPGPTPDDSALRKHSLHKRRKTMSVSTSAQNISDPAFAMPALPIRPGVANPTESSMPATNIQPVEGEKLDAALAARDDAVNMEDPDTIAVAAIRPQAARAASVSLGTTPIPSNSTLPTASKLVRFADELLQTVDDSSTQTESQISAASHLASTAQSTTNPADKQPENELIPEDSSPEMIDPHSGLPHDPTNRGENDQTGVPGERIYATIRIAGTTYTVDRSKAVLDTPQEWKTWAVKAKDGWFRYRGSSTHDWTSQDSIANLNRWRDQALNRLGFRARPRDDFTAEEREWLFELIVEEGGARPNRPMAELTADFNKEFKRGRGERSISALVDRLCEEYKACGGQQKLRQSATVGKRKAQEVEVEVEHTTVQGRRRGRALIEGANAEVGRAEVTQTKSVTHADLLSQFQARKGDRQKPNAQLSPEDMETE